MCVSRVCSLKIGVSISARCNEVVDHCYSLIVVYILHSPHFVWIWQKEWQRKHIHAHARFPVITHRGQQSAILFESTAWWFLEVICLFLQECFRKKVRCFLPSFHILSLSVSIPSPVWVSQINLMDIWRKDNKCKGCYELWLN